MALAIDASTPALATSSTASVTTASFTPPAGAVIVVAVAANSDTGTDGAFSSMTATGHTFTRRVLKSNNATSLGGAGTNGDAEFWTATALGTAITVTGTNALTTAATGSDKAIKVWVVTGADTSSLTNVAAASATSGLPSVALAGCLVGSHVLAASSDWSQLGAGTAGTGQTLSSGDEYNPTGHYTSHAWRTTAVRGSAGSQTMNLTLPTGQQYNIVALEIRVASGATTKRPMSTVNRAALIRASSF